MYFALQEFKKKSTFEHIYCEQDKLDFEIWNTDRFDGFQVKLTASGLSAKEVNSIFVYYFNKAVSSGRKDKNFCFVFRTQPVKSLGHLLAVVQNGTRCVNYSGYAKKYIETALKGIPVDAFPIDFHLLDKDKIEHLVFSVSVEILEERMGVRDTIPSGITRNFITRFRDEIDRISCEENKSKRIYTSIEIGSLIDMFLRTVQIERYQGQNRIEIKLPKNDTVYPLETHVIVKQIPLDPSETSDEGQLFRE